MGLGPMGCRHARVLGSLGERYALVGGYDIDASASGVDGLARLISEADAIERSDVLVVSTPIQAHAATVQRALLAGKHVLVEKPLCGRASEAEAMAAASVASSARVFVGHSERFNPVVRVLARLIRVEPVLGIDLLRVGPSRPSECGVLLNLAVHDLDLAAYLGGGDATLRGAIGAPTSGASGEDMAHVLLTTGSGALAHVHVDRTAPRRRREITVQTESWIYDGDLLSHRLTRTSRATGAPAEVPLPIEEPLAAQARALADALDGG
ncbi:MAG: Gfo/Idh/MocA family protein, partial [Polyangiaceae bacterium]